MLLKISICFLLIQMSLGEQPLTLCPNMHPFKTKENTCADFAELCIKKGDYECDVIQSACNQCPLSNFTILMYLDMVNIKDYSFKKLQTLENITNNLKEEFRIFREYTDKTMREIKHNQEASDRRPESLHIFILLLIILFFVILVTENRFKLLSKICGRYCKKEKYHILQSRKSKREKDLVRTSILDNKLSSLDSHLNMILRQLQNSNNNVQSVITCRIIGFDKTIKVDLFHTDSVVKIKKRICNKWSDAKTHFYKIMNLKLKNTVLDNNQYLLSLLSSEDEAVDCEIDEKIDSEQIVILQMRGNVNVPDLIQINKNEKIDALKQIIYKFTDSRDIAILRGFEELKNECTIEYYNLKDDDVLTAIKRGSGKLVIRSVLEENESIVVEYSNIDSIYSINNKIANKFNYDSENIFLFLNEECLNENKFIYEYNINNESVIKYYYLMKINGVKLGESIDKGYNSEIVKGRNETTKTDLLIMKYDLRVADLKLDGEIIKTLIQGQMQNYHRLFLQLHGIYSDVYYLYVAFENMEGGTLTNYLKKHPNVTDDQMRIWSKQILEYLQCIHRNGNIYIDLKPYDIFVDKDNNLKIHGVTLNKYFYKTNRKEKIRNMLKNKNLPLTYLAPEVRAERFYDESADVWSFGVILIYIATGKCPDIGTSDVLEYNLKSENRELKRCIDSCIKVDPKERSKIDTLMQHTFLHKQ